MYKHMNFMGSMMCKKSISCRRCTTFTLAYRSRQYLVSSITLDHREDALPREFASFDTSLLMIIMHKKCKKRHYPISWRVCFASSTNGKPVTFRKEGFTQSCRRWFRTTYSLAQRCFVCNELGALNVGVWIRSLGITYNESPSDILILENFYPLHPSSDKRLQEKVHSVNNDRHLICEKKSVSFQMRPINVHNVWSYFTWV